MGTGRQRVESTKGAMGNAASAEDVGPVHVHAGGRYASSASSSLLLDDRKMSSRRPGSSGTRLPALPQVSAEKLSPRLGRRPLPRAGSHCHDNDACCSCFAWVHHVDRRPLPGLRSVLASCDLQDFDCNAGLCWLRVCSVTGSILISSSCMDSSSTDGQPSVVVHFRDAKRVNLPQFSARPEDSDPDALPFTFSIDFTTENKPVDRKSQAWDSSPATSKSSSRSGSVGRLRLQARTAVEFLTWLHALRRIFFAISPSSPVTPAGQAAFKLILADDGAGLSTYLRARDVPTVLGTRDGMGNTPALLAARFGAVKSLKLLLQCGAPICDMNLNGESAICLAAAGGHTRAIQLLLTTLRCRCNDSHHVSRRSKLTSVPGSDATLCKLDATDAVMFAVNHAGIGGITPLHLAAAGGHPETIELLLTSGADGMACDDSGRTLAHYAAGIHDALASRGTSSSAPPSQREDHRLAALALVVEACEDTMDWFDGRGNTALHVAAQCGWTEGVQLLLEAGANPHAWDSDGMTPIALSATAGDVQTTGILEEYEDSYGVADPESTPTPHPAKWTHIKQAALCAATPSEAEKMDRIMKIWGAFFDNALQAGRTPRNPLPNHAKLQPSPQPASDASEWMYGIDPDSGYGYYYNSWTGETMWDEPPGDNGMYSPIDTSLAAVTAAGSDDSTSSWSRHYDEASGCYYWLNDATGESQWEN